MLGFRDSVTCENVTGFQNNCLLEMFVFMENGPCAKYIGLRCAKYIGLWCAKYIELWESPHVH